MEDFTIRLDNDMYLQFIGEELACAVDVDSCDTYVVYITNRSKFVCQKINSSIYADKYECAIVGTISEIIKFFGIDNLAMELYDDAGI